MPRMRAAMRGAIINRAPHALSPSGAAWLAHYPQVLYRTQRTVSTPFSSVSVNPGVSRVRGHVPLGASDAKVLLRLQGG